MGQEVRLTPGSGTARRSQTGDPEQNKELGENDKRQKARSHLWQREIRVPRVSFSLPLLFNRIMRTRKLFSGKFTPQEARFLLPTLH